MNAFLPQALTRNAGLSRRSLLRALPLTGLVLSVGLPGIAGADEPAKFGGDAMPVETFRRQRGKPLSQIKAKLRAENRTRADACAILAVFAFGHHLV